MPVESDKLEINNFQLESSVEVEDVVQQINILKKNKMLIHIVSYIHNTVLVQNLLKELKKKIPEAQIVLLKHDNKVITSVTVFTIETDDEKHISDEILKELYIDNYNKKQSIDEYRVQLFKRYFTDHLTNLPNLYQLRKDLQNCDDAGLILLKIDNFQAVNNFYGFVVGDYVLEYVGKFLKEILKEHKVYRLSGAEYALVTETRLGFYQLKDYLAEIYEKIKNIEIVYQDTKIYVDFTLASSSNRDNTSIFSKVSMALIYAKQQGVPFWIYEDRMNFEHEYKRNLELSHVVREAVENKRIVPYYQAIMDNKSGKIVKYECLARLVDHNDKILSPMLFIPIAKTAKIYNEVTKLIVDKSFEMFHESEYEFSVNLSIEDIMSSEIFNFIIQKLKNNRSIANRVTFELLESEAVKDYKKVDRFIGEVSRYGAKIAIDDFGSGYSNFSYLTKINADYIKIDGTLIENIDVEETSYIVVKTIVEFAKRLGIKTVAEYVHSSVVMDKVKELGIDYSQGFYIDEPSVNLKSKP
ncbi:MAG TPA: GGDEF domain-containing protein [Sulfurimonas autotrophica]|uniref:GGDEF domain-containing protein n=1 Tax=Sulfurimonas autotrophica TaxID=202747 RepID=A0A7C3G8L3_9BACT|nr:GGDEF domain-containing protein [Sulfurimonas autotrophica]